MLKLQGIELVAKACVDHRPLEEWCFSSENALTRQSNNIQCGTAHVEGGIHLDNIRIVLVQLGEPDVSEFGSLPVEDGSE